MMWPHNKSMKPLQDHLTRNGRRKGEEKKGTSKRGSENVVKWPRPMIESS